MVDDTAELDRVLQSGHSAAAASLAARLRPTIESSSGSDSDSSSRSNRSKLSDALHRVSSFSPKRPRSTQSNRSQTQGAGPSTYPNQRFQPSPQRSAHEAENDIPTPKPRSKRAYVRPQPDVVIQPPTPSSTGSRFTKMARGLAKDIEAEQKSIWSEAVNKDRDTLAHSTVHERRGSDRNGPRIARNPFSDIGNSLGADASVKDRKGTPRTSKIHLPDVTGLTSAVASPAKNGLIYYGYEGGEESKEAESTCLIKLLFSRINSLSNSPISIGSLRYSIQTCPS